MIEALKFGICWIPAMLKYKHFLNIQVFNILFKKNIIINFFNINIISDDVTTVCISADINGKYLISGSKDNSIMVWSM